MCLVQYPIIMWQSAEDLARAAERLKNAMARRMPPEAVSAIVSEADGAVHRCRCTLNGMTVRRGPGIGGPGCGKQREV